jgi:hypothetical protein
MRPATLIQGNANAVPLARGNPQPDQNDHCPEHVTRVHAIEAPPLWWSAIEKGMCL